MSHYTVLVIGKGIDKQLAPYSENLEVPEYVREKVTAAEKKLMVDYYKEKRPELKGKKFEEIYALHGESWNSNSWRADEKGVWRSYSTYNPKSKWDWYSIGGRWTGFFRLTKEAFEAGLGTLGRVGLMTEPAEIGTADQARICDIDFAGMEAEAKAKAEKRYDEIWAIIGSTPPNKPWEEVLKMDELGGIDAKRKYYWGQPRCAKWQVNTEVIGYGSDPDDYLVDRDTFVQSRVNSAYTPYALVHKGEWYAKGEMGWWGMSNDTKTEDEWSAEVVKLIKSLPKNTQLTLVDCHI